MSEQATTTPADEARAARAADVLRRPSPAWLRDVRRQAFERFEALGWPTTRHEDWRQTDVRGLSRAHFVIAGAAAMHADRDAIAPVALPGLGGPALVFVNGRWAHDGGAPGALPRGVRIEPLGAALAADGVGLEAHFGRLTASAANPFVALNTALAEDGVLVVLPTGTRLERPIEVLFLSDGRRGEAGIEMHPRVLIVAGEGSEATVVEVHAGGPGSFANVVTEIAVGAGAGITHWVVQRSATDAFHMGRVQARLDRDSRFVSGTLQMGAALARNEVDVVFGAEGGDCQLDGLFVAGGQQHIDVRTNVDHAQPNCASRQLYKGVLGDRAHGVFNGRIVVRKDAQKTAAHQTNRNVILSEAALVDTKPQLEIYADDVQCTHGATIGRLDEDALFYLRSRGIGARDAHALLVHAFVHEIVSRVRPAALQPGLDAALAPRLATLVGSAPPPAERRSP
jgi:Fe-S cluster assembly protein SufD